MSENTIQQSFEELYEAGVYEFAGLDEKTGEPTFRLNADVAKAKAPDVLANADMKANEALFRAIEEGYIEWNVTMHSETGELEASIVLTEKCDELFADMQN